MKPYQVTIGKRKFILSAENYTHALSICKAGRNGPLPKNIRIQPLKH